MLSRLSPDSNMDLSNNKMAYDSYINNFTLLEMMNGLSQRGTTIVADRVKAKVQNEQAVILN